MTINDLCPGESGLVIKIGASGVIKHRLIDMGLTPGVSITVRRVAPLGDPIVLSLRGYELSIRRSEAARISVQRKETHHDAG